MSFLFKKSTQEKSIEREVVKKCDHCDGKGYRKFKHTETDRYALRYGAPEHYHGLWP